MCVWECCIFSAERAKAVSMRSTRSVARILPEARAARESASTRTHTHTHVPPRPLSVRAHAHSAHILSLHARARPCDTKRCARSGTQRVLGIRTFSGTLARGAPPRKQTKHTRPHATCLYIYSLSTQQPPPPPLPPVYLFNQCARALEYKLTCVCVARICCTLRGAYVAHIMSRVYGLVVAGVCARALGGARALLRVRACVYQTHAGIHFPCYLL